MENEHNFLKPYKHSNIARIIVKGLVKAKMIL